jgi:hypothetical protein
LGRFASSAAGDGGRCDAVPGFGPGFQQSIENTELFASLLLTAAAADGVTGTGSLAFAPNGDLFEATYYTSNGRFVRITPDGEGSVFDTVESLVADQLSVAVDSRNNVYVLHAENGGTLYKYPNADPKARFVLATYFTHADPAGACLSEDESAVYVASVDGLFAVDVDTGQVSQLWVAGPWAGFVGTGVAVYRFQGPGVPGDVNCDGRTDAFDARILALACVNPHQYQLVYSTCSLANGDVSGDGAVDGAVIMEFVGLIEWP